MGRLAQLQARIQRAATREELWKIAAEINPAVQAAGPVLVRPRRRPKVQRARASLAKRRAKADTCTTTLTEALHLAADTGDPGAVLFVLDGEAAALDELYYAECRRTIPSARKPSLAEIERDS
ncbi:MAG TPA: hypothetical protein VE999_06630 [Gemmataceae bacterium]|nr:hypothetical protein [Gemmataceae bacterium]